MAVDYTVYENWYKYMSGVINQIQGTSGYPENTYTSRIGASDQSFTQTFLDILQRMSVSSSKETARDTAKEQTVTQIQTGSQSMDAIFEEAAQLYNVPLNLLKAIGKAESGFNANAVSPAGAQGVMQLMPATARSLGVEDPFDARSNIMGGAKYISQMLARYNGDIELALAAYNAGSGNVAKYGGVPPFRETRNYISRIKSYMNSELTIGKTVEVQWADTKKTSGADEEEPDTLLNYWDLLRAGMESQHTVRVGTGTSAGSVSGLTWPNTQYMADMMRLQMLSKASALGNLSDSSDENNFFL